MANPLLISIPQGFGGGGPVFRPPNIGTRPTGGGGGRGIFDRGFDFTGIINQFGPAGCERIPPGIIRDACEAFVAGIGGGGGGGLDFDPPLDGDGDPVFIPDPTPGGQGGNGCGCENKCGCGTHKAVSSYYRRTPAGNVIRVEKGTCIPGKKRRRFNPANGKANARAIARLGAGESQAKKLLKAIGYRKISKTG